MGFCGSPPGRQRDQARRTASRWVSSAPVRSTETRTSMTVRTSGSGAGGGEGVDAVGTRSFNRIEAVGWARADPPAIPRATP
ncbi:hypothetical protein ACJ65_10430 [Kocuria rhizophila]|nr:hypothetical protein ACJ65_10430 [Kocuria rhizophila]